MRVALALLACLALTATGAAGPASASVPGDGGATELAKKKKKKCKKKKKKKRQADSSAKKKKKCKKKKKKGPSVSSVRATLDWNDTRDVDLIAVTLTNGFNGVGPPGAFGQYYNMNTHNEPVPDTRHSGDVFGGPETFTDLDAGAKRTFWIFGCVPNIRPLGGAVTLTATIRDTPSSAPRTVSKVADPVGEGAGYLLGSTPAGVPMPAYHDPCL